MCQNFFSISLRLHNHISYQKIACHLMGKTLLHIIIIIIIIKNENDIDCQLIVSSLPWLLGFVRNIIIAIDIYNLHSFVIINYINKLFNIFMCDKLAIQKYLR